MNVRCYVQAFIVGIVLSEAGWPATEWQFWAASMAILAPVLGLRQSKR